MFDLTGDVDPLVRGQVPQQAEPQAGVDGGQQRPGHQAQVQPPLEPAHTAEEDL